MITDSFNLESGKISPEDIYGEGKFVSDICIVTFSYKLLDRIIKESDVRKVGEIHSTNGHINVYSLIYQNRKICLYNSYMGAALAGTCMIEASYLFGVKKFIMFGSCGRLSKSIPNNCVIVPTAAYRDEGFSYHYAPKNDYIDIKNHTFVETFLSSKKIPYISGRNWTTDAFYKETESEIKKRQREGCISVEMECAGCQAVSDFYKWDLYDYFFGGDLLDAEIWDKSNLGTDSEKRCHFDLFSIALDMAVSIK